MKNLIKKILKESVPNFPQRKRGEVIVFTDRDTDPPFVKHLAKKLGYEAIGEYTDSGYVIKTPVGKEEQAGQDFVDNYPEFFNSWDREDIKDTYVWNEIDFIEREVRELWSHIGNLNKFGSSRISKEWNAEIDRIIQRLQDIKTDE